MSLFSADLERVPALLPYRRPGSQLDPKLVAAVIRGFDVEANPRYQRRWYVKANTEITCCNFFARELAAALGIKLPPLTANETVDWLRSPEGQREWLEAPEDHARAAAAAGAFALAMLYQNPHGHVGVVRAPPDDPKIVWPAGVTCIAQAGYENFEAAPLTRCFGSFKPSFFVHLNP